jgi:phosphoribosylaminoimidazolecarboxamide formyltransferase/IMP cyclohydrolase
MAGPEPQHLRKKLIEHNCSSEAEDSAIQSKTEDPRMNALLSVSDKTGIVEFARPCTPSASSCCPPAAPPSCWPTRPAGDRGGRVTGFPEMLDGRVKTLHPKVHGGLLARRDLPEHMAALAEHGIDTIDLLVVNLYPFEATVAKAGCTLEDAIENIDIGGPAMVRSAAKNWKDVGVLTDASQYAGVLAELKANGKLSDKTRFALSVAAFNRIASTTAPSATTCRRSTSKAATPEAAVPGQSNGRFVKVQDLRYGENRTSRPPSTATCTRPRLAGHGVQLQGKELSYNNIADADAAWECVKSFDAPACVIVKHANPCGVAVGARLEAYSKAFQTDPTSAFGGIIAFNRPLDAPRPSRSASSSSRC